MPDIPGRIWGGALFFRIFRIRAVPLIGYYRIVLFNPMLTYKIPSSTAGEAPITPLVLGIENETLLFVMWDFFYTFVKQTLRVMTGDEFFKKENPIGWLFERFPELNAGQVAKAMGINETLFRNYVNGSKRPSASRIMDIENFLQKLGKELSEIHLL